MGSRAACLETQGPQGTALCGAGCSLPYLPAALVAEGTGQSKVEKIKAGGEM